MTAKKTNTSTKATELQMLDEIFSLDGYLADSLTQEDLRTMKNNINSDFPIFMGTRMDLSKEISRLEDLNEALQDTVTELRAGLKSRETRIQDLEEEVNGLKEIKRRLMIKTIQAGNEMDLEDLTDHEEVIKLKLQECLPLTEPDRQALLMIMDLAE